MTAENVSGNATEPHNLIRFVQVGEDDYAQALTERRSRSP
jgi:hypothetical protein